MNKFNSKICSKLNRSDRGFTLVELIVTIAIMAILISATVAGALSWIDWSRFNRENEYAQTLFFAAQNQLTEYAANGRLNEMKEELRGDKTDGSFSIGLSIPYDKINTLTDDAGNPYETSKVWPASVGKTDDKVGDYTDTLLALRTESGGYEAYMANPQSYKESNPEGYWVYEILGSYVYDVSILENGSICLEFTPDDGQVFAVLYTDRNSKMEYRGTSDTSTAVPNASYRKQSYREDCMVGFYDVETLTAATKNPGNSNTPEITKLKLHNKEAEYLSFSVKKVSADKEYKLKYDITIVDDATKKSMLAFTVDGSKIKNRENAEIQKCSVTKYVDQNKNKVNKINLGMYPVLAYREKDNSIRIIIDAADLQATTNQYNQNFKSIIQSANVAAESDTNIKFAKTLSYFRFGVGTDDIYCSVQARGEGVKTSPVKLSNTENPVFAKKSSKSESKHSVDEFDIKNTRHFYNIRYIEDLTANNIKLTMSANEEDVTSYSVKADIDVAQFKSDGWMFNTSGASVFTFADADTNRFNCDYPSVKQLRAQDSIDGNDHVISGISMSEAENATYGIYTSDSDATKLNSTKPVGLVVVNRGTIENLKLDKITSEGRKFVGGFCGVNAGNIKKLETVNTDDESKVTGVEYVGGIVGFQMPVESKNNKSNTQKVEELTNRANVYGVRAVGGILGMVRNEFEVKENGQKIFNLSEYGLNISSNSNYQKSKIEVTDCQNFGPVYGVNTSELQGIYGAANGTDDQLEPRFIGGIVGYAYNHQYSFKTSANTDNITIKECISSPQYADTKLLAMLSDKDILEDNCKGAYVGGVVGYSHYTTISDCSTLAEDGKEGFVVGNQYVGGIVGLNIGPASGKGILGGLFESFWRGETVLSGGAEAGINEANVIGVKYVGGITGNNSAVKSTVSSNNIDPEAHKTGDILVPENDIDYNMILKNWVNRGVVIATDSYSGGITGYNAGWIYNCNSNVDAEKAEQFFENIYSGAYVGGIAGYNNGIIGNTEREVTNNGEKAAVKKNGKSSTLSTQCYVLGEKYVGGVVGYNDVNSIIEDYKISGGYVKGDIDSYFVGGYVGLNTSVLLLEKEISSGKYEAREIFANPNEISGKYFVGGIIGANMINLAGTDFANATKISGVFRTDNFLGQLKSDAFAGGFVGYNLLVKNSNDSTYIYTLQNAIISEFEAVDTANGTQTTSSYGVYALDDEEPVEDPEEDANNEPEVETDPELISLSAKVNILEDLDTLCKDNGIKEPAYAENTVFYLSGEEGKQTANNLGRIVAKIYVGGVIGYCDSNSKLYVENVKNATPIVAKSAIIREDEQKDRTTDFLGNAKTYRYSYAGGIIGKVAANVVIDECTNTSTGSVTSAGTYRGSLAEINEGIIINCTPGNFGSSAFSYCGGLCGLNKKDGLIKYCKINNKTVTGKNVVGGIAAENFGKISAISVDNGKINCDKNDIYGVAGILTAFNGDGGEVVVSKDILGIKVSSKGNMAGGVVGINSGTVSVSFVEAGKTDPEDTTKNIKEKKADGETAKAPLNAGYVTITGSVSGSMYVGGVIGINYIDSNEDVVEKFVNEANVTAKEGEAAGIVADNRVADKAKGVTGKITNCINKGNVEATNGGNAGGITAINSGIISKCTDYSSIKSPKGMSGGITAVNKKNAVITECNVRPLSDDEGEELIFSSIQKVGGVAATNAGLIEKTKLDRVVVENYSTSKQSDIGVIAGVNEATGEIRIAAGEEEINNCKAMTYSDLSNVGGIAGTNSGVIIGADLDTVGLPVSVVNVYVAFKENSGKVASFGGVAGKNEGEISKISVEGNIGHDSSREGELLYGDENTGYGGIAGYNNATISDCTFDGTLWAHGSAAGFANIGGIAGKNAKDGSISKCIIGARGDNKTRIYAGEVEAQLAMENSFENNTYTLANGTPLYSKLVDETSHSYIGGIAGYNEGSVTCCNNAARSVDEVLVEGMTGFVGGIIGKNAEGGYLSGSAATILSTGKNWTVRAHGQINDVGTGGIVSTNYSGKSVEYVENYATVINQTNSNVSCGGIFGRNEQNESAYIEMKNCKNYADVTGTHRAAGFAASCRRKGIKFENCTNYGDMYAADGSAIVAGFVAQFQYVDTDITFVKCYNHGSLLSTKTNDPIAGFVARVDNANNGMNLSFSDCVNTGVIKRFTAKDTKTTTVTTTNLTGAAGFVSSTDGIAYIYFDLCRNYGNSNAIGMCNSKKNVYMTNCLDTSGNTVKDTGADTLLPLSVKAIYGETQNNYYIAKQNGGAASTGDTYWSLATSSIYKNIKVSPNNVTDMFVELDANKYNFQCMEKNTTEKLHFDVDYSDDCEGIGTFNFYLASNNVYSYKVKLTDSTNRSTTVSVDGITVKGSSTFSENNRQSIDVTGLVADGKLSSSKVMAIDMEVTSKTAAGAAATVSFYGFTWSRIGASVEEPLKNRAELMIEETGTSFGITSDYPLKAYGPIVNSNANNVVVADENVYFADNRYYDGSTCRFTATASAKNTDVKVSIDVSYSDSAKGIDDLIVYLAPVSGDTYSYRYDINYADGSTVKKPKITLPKATEFGKEIVLDIDDAAKEVTSIDIYAQNLNKNTVSFGGFRWTENGNSTSMLLASEPINYPTVMTSRLRELIVSDETTTGAYLIYPAGSNIAKTTNISMSGNNLLRTDIATNGYYADQSKYEASFDKDNTGWNNQTRAGLYKELDPQFTTFVKTDVYNTVDDLAMPQNLKVTNSRGQFTFTWNKVNGAYGYDVYYELVDSEGHVKYTSDHTSLAAVSRIYKESAENIEKNWTADGDYTIVFYVKAVSAYHVQNPDALDAARHDSEYNHIEQQKLISLPMPLYHLEMIEGDQVIMVIDNYDEYEDYKDVCDVILTFKKTDSLNVTVDMSNGKYSEPFKLATRTTAASDITYSAYAKSLNAAYIDSISNATFGTMINEVELVGATYEVGTIFDGFVGDTVDTLGYDVTVTAKTRDMTMSADMVIFDEELGLPVSVANGLIHASNRVNSILMKFTTTLSGFSGEIVGKDITIRTYPYTTQGELLKFGHMVAQNVEINSVDDLMTITDEEYHNAAGEHSPQIIVEGTELKPGYILYLNEDGTYNIYYCSSLAQYVDGTKHYHVSFVDYSLARDDDGNPLKDSDGREYYEVVTNKTTEGANVAMHPAPVLEEDVVIDRTGTHDTYEFEWDKNKTGSLYTNAKYGIELFGITQEGVKVSLRTVESTSDRKIKFTDERDNWNYTTLELRVVRIGTINDTNMTQILPRMSTKEYENKLRLDAKNIFSAELIMDENEQYIKDELIYKIEWDAITDSVQLDNLAGYLFKAVVKDAEDEEEANVHYYKTGDIDISNETSGYENAVIMDVTEYQTSPEYSDRKTGRIDLNDFGGDVNIILTVVSVAKPDSREYIDSLESDEFEFYVQGRLDVPDVKCVSVDITKSMGTYDSAEENSVTSKEYEKGLVVKYTDTVTYADETKNPTIYVAVSVFDEPEAGVDSTGYGIAFDRNRVGDFAEGKSGNFWNSEAVGTPIEKQAAVKMTGDATAAEYTVKLAELEEYPGQYAGKWMKLVFKAESVSKISSCFTDEDQEKYSTVNNYWIHIPKLTIDNPDIIDDTVMDEDDNPLVNNGTWYYIKDQGIKTSLEEEEAADHTFGVKTLCVKEDKCLDFYTMKVFGMTEDNRAVDGSVSTPVYNIYMQKSDLGWDVFVAADETSDVTVSETEKPEEINACADENAMYVGTLSEGSELMLYDISKTYTNSSLTINIPLMIKLEDGTFNIWLPDVTSVNGSNKSDDSAYFLTSRVVIEASVSEENENYYNNPEITTWYRETEGSKNSVVMETITEEDLEEILEKANSQGEVISTQSICGKEIEVIDDLEDKITEEINPEDEKGTTPEDGENSETGDEETDPEDGDAPEGGDDTESGESPEPVDGENVQSGDSDTTQPESGESSQSDGSGNVISNEENTVE